MDFIHITLIDIIDIFVVALLMFYIYKFTKGTSAPGILAIILFIYLLWITVRALNMEMLSAILGNLTSVGVLALIIVFQPEIRRFLQAMGIKNRQRRNSFWAKILDFRNVSSLDLEYLVPLVRACTDMSRDKTGALIVIQQQIDLTPVTETGIALDAAISSSLLENIFFKNSPLHDGAVVINNSRIVAAKCILPSTHSRVPVSFGMRHRAALGVSEIYDALVIVVSEETGMISIARNGQIKCGIAAATLKDEIMTHLNAEQPE